MEKNLGPKENLLEKEGRWSRERERGGLGKKEAKEREK